MEKLKAIEVTFDPDDDELVGAFFRFDKLLGYFTFCYCPGENDTLYIERNDQIYAVYSNNIDFKLSRTCLRVSVGLEVAKAINSDNQFEIAFHLDDISFEGLKTTLAIIEDHLNKHKRTQ